ncbi:VOC family protein [Ruegeria sp. 2205SS24-7]|uniref:VOC family protein n=1 Tax=Ruegeria discodermiae TaxID=3064389 RepID=UPI00274213BA|nr:VOC family protein [Ruegeria sp. 2205SS24-7]MDP5218798.1 VOC family protein [Ruegeria sp. 2205SS24-7]
MTASAQSKTNLGKLTMEHVMISTGDYAETISWYVNKLDFDIHHEWTVPDLPGIKLAYLKRGDFLIEVVETPDVFQVRKTPRDLSEALADRGIGHLAFLTPDVDGVASILTERGVEMVVPPTSFPDAGRRLIFIQDNNGNFIEFLTPLLELEGEHDK